MAPQLPCRRVAPQRVHCLAEALRPLFQRRDRAPPPARAGHTFGSVLEPSFLQIQCQENVVCNFVGDAGAVNLVLL